MYIIIFIFLGILIFTQIRTTQYILIDSLLYQISIQIRR